MRVLLDESLPRKLAAELPGHDVKTVQQAGWSGTKNGKLLRLAAGSFDVFITADRNLQYQQNLESIDLAVVVLKAASNSIESYMPLIDELRRVLTAIRPHDVIEVAAKAGPVGLPKDH